MKKYVFMLILAGALGVNAQSVPTVGRKAAQKYFEKSEDAVQSALSGENIMMLHLGTYMNSQAYQWKLNGKQENTGKVNYGVTYLFDQWGGMDLNFRADFSEYTVDSTRAVKLSMMPLLTFPRAETRFPLYFGLGIGAGVFFQQIENESNLSLDYQLVAGARFQELFETVGLFFEFGLKNHLHLLSDGQFNGTAFAAGLVFTF